MRDALAENELELRSLATRLELDLASLAVAESLTEERADQLGERLQRLERRRQQLGPVNPLAQEEYAEALAHIAELEGRRGDLEAALRELQALIRDTDRQIEEVFEETFAATARNFDELVGICSRRQRSPAAGRLKGSPGGRSSGARPSRPRRSPTKARTRTSRRAWRRHPRTCGASRSSSRQPANRPSA